VSDVPQPEWQSTHSRWSLVARRIRIPLGFVSAILFVWLARPTPSSLIAGTLVMIPGLILRGLASGHVQKDKELTTGGPYGYMRNPLYMGSLLMAGGFAIAARNWWILAAMALTFALIYVPVIAGEERFLRQAFPEYENYARQVPRMFPRLTAYRKGQSSYSSARFMQHREYQASLGCAAVVAILIIKLIVR
jgi:protein-S-isoprenylcysteine O-methyltransferase Ste14